MHTVLQFRWPVLSLILLSIGCQTKEKALTDWVLELPADYTLLEESALDSLIEFGEYLDPKGDSKQQTIFHFQHKEEVAQISLSFTTGQKGFSNVQLKSLGKTHLIACNFSGSPGNSFINSIDLFEINSGGVILTKKSVLDSLIQNEHLVLSTKEELNGVTGCDFFTENLNTVRFYYLAIDYEFKNKEVIFEWDDAEFSVKKN